jgi:hypothetical protein
MFYLEHELDLSCIWIRSAYTTGHTYIYIIISYTYNYMLYIYMIIYMYIYEYLIIFA